MKKLITRGLIFVAGFSLGRALYDEKAREINKERIVNCISKLFWGEDAKTHFDYKTKYYRPYASSYRNYSSFTNAHEAHRGRVKNYEYESEVDAAEVLSKMKGFIESYGFASIGDLEDCIELVEGSEIKFVRNYDDGNLGWDDLSLASVRRFSENRFIITWPFVRYRADVDDKEDPDEEG